VEVLIKCLDAATCEWLKEKVAVIKPWPEADLSVKTDDKIPKPRIGSVWIPTIPGTADMSDEEILARLTIQNKNWGVNAHNWRVINSKAEPKGRRKWRKGLTRSSNSTNTSWLTTSAL
jgi:hypothetical protein